MDVFGKATALPDLSAESDVLQADFHYEAYFSDVALKRDACDKLVSGDLFAQQLYEGKISLFGNDAVKADQPSAFVLAPVVNATPLPREDVRHALYSLRNLMALRSQVMRVYQKVWESEDEVGLYTEAMHLMRRSRQKKVAVGDWDKLVCDNGETMFRLAELAAKRTRQQAEVRNLGILFESIIGELYASKISGISPLWTRMRLPFEHTRDLLDERSEMLSRTGKQCEIILQMLHSRMLAEQQGVLASIVDSLP